MTRGPKNIRRALLRLTSFTRPTRPYRSPPREPSANLNVVEPAPSSRIPVRLRWALLIVVLYHGSLLLFRSYQRTYDAYVHIFLGDHYARDWFSTWDQRWYTGFTTVSYPPGTHMGVGALSKVTGDLELAFALLQIFALLLLTVGVYRFSTIWVNQEAAANAALLLAGSSAIAETVHVFGQLPTTWAIAFLLNSIPYLHRWSFQGRLVDLICGISVLAACTAGHHVTTLFGSIFFLGPVLAYGLLEQSRKPLPSEPGGQSPRLSTSTLMPLIARRLRRVLPAVLRICVLGGGVLAALVLVVLPYWWWSATDPITQIPIPHGSRNNFLVDRNIGLVFFVIPWGMMIFVLPYALVRATLDRKWPIAASILLLFVLGTGGTTPIPRALLGPAFEVLTLDRFTFWASMLILPLGGLFVQSLEHGTIRAWLHAVGGRFLVRPVQIGFVLGIVVVSMFSATLAQYRPFQPDQIDMDPIVAFIEKDQHERWRYLTLGFGDQVAWLSAQTTATQVDGNYHSVRRLPELTSTSVERLEGAKYRGVDGLGSLQQFLEVPEKYNLKYVFSNDKFYDPLLHFSGWQRLGPLENGIEVWERADIPPLPAELPVREVAPWQRLLWGTVPPFSILAALLVLSWTAIGRPGLSSRYDPARIRRRSLFGPLRFLDNGLRRIGDKMPDPMLGPKSPRSDHRYIAMLRQRMGRTLSRRARFVRLGLLALVILLLPVRTMTKTAEVPGPADSIESYYDDLDFRRWNDAYAALDPQTRPDYELWRLQQSVQGGMLASYAKLDDLDVEVTAKRSTDRVTVQVNARYLTSLSWYPIVRTHEMVRRNGQWFVEAEPTEATIPPDQLVRRSDVNYVIQGRRRVTSGTTELTDVQDRPELFLDSATLLNVEGRPVLVGEVRNLDVDPADITITGVLRNKDSEIIGRYNAAADILHTIRPRESTPFMIQFEEVAAGTDLDFDPLDFEALKLTDEVFSAEVYAKAVVTTGGLDRGLGVHQVELEETSSGGYTLSGQLRNDGVNEAVVPRVLISYLDDNGDVLWVQNVYLEYSVRSQRTRPFSVELDSIADHTLSDIEVKKYHNAITTTEDGLLDLPTLIEAPDGVPYSSIRLDLSTFDGGL